MNLLEVLDRRRPLEVYVGAVVCYIVLFINLSELFSYRIDIEDFFSIRDSIVYGLIRGIGDDHLRGDTAYVLFWFISVAYVGIVLIKARRISDWLWNEDR